jgi:hypothetical protein
VLITRGQVGAENADAAARSLAAYDVAARAETAAAQAAEDPTAPPQPAPPKTEPGHVDELASQAETAGHDAIKARATAATARARVETTAPGALEAREDARRAEEARPPCSPAGSSPPTPTARRNSRADSRRSHGTTGPTGTFPTPSWSTPPPGAVAVRIGA